MKISGHTFETFIVSSCRNSHGFGELDCRHSQVQPILGQIRTRTTAARCFLPSSALNSGRSLRSHSFSTMRLNGVDTLRQLSIPISAPANAHVFDQVELRDPARPIPMTFQSRQLSFPSHHLHPTPMSPTHILSTAVSSTTSDLLAILYTAAHQHGHKRKCLVFHAERIWSCQIIGASSVPYMAHSSLPTYWPDAAKGSSGGNSKYSDFLASPYKKAAVTSASRIALLVPFTCFVFARGNHRSHCHQTRCPCEQCESFRIL